MSISLSVTKLLAFQALLQLHALPNRRRPVESLIKNKVRQSLFNGELADLMFKRHSTPLRQSFDSLMFIADTLMQGSEPALNLMSLRLICAMFINLDDYFQQEIVCDLIAKIGSGGGGGCSTLRSTSLSTLEVLSIKNTSALGRYSLLAASLLDHTESMSLDDVRRVVDILSRLAFSSQSMSSSGLRDDLHIVVRKQISSSKTVVKRMGVVGAVAIVKNICPRSKTGVVEDHSTSTSTSTQAQGSGFR